MAGQSAPPHGASALGVGEWHQHPQLTLPAREYGLPPDTVTTRERVTTLIGLALDAAGLVLFVIGVYKLLLA